MEKGAPILPGLPEPLPKWKRQFGWSVSRHRLWRHCRRAFFLDVVAPHMVSPPVHPQRLDRLRRLSPFGVLRGQAVHAALDAGIAHARTGGADPGRKALLALDQGLRAFARFPSRTIAEVANGFPFEADALEAARAEGRAMLERFFPEVWPRYAARAYLGHEEGGRLQAAGHLVRLRADLLTRGPDGLLITDWKTGADRGDGGDDLQLGTYILWATRAHDAPPERVRAELVFLRDLQVRATSRTQAQLAETEEAIAASAAEMLAVEGLADAPTSPGPHCGACRFATACDAGMRELQAQGADARARPGTAGPG